MNKTYPLKQLEIPIELIGRYGPFSEFKQNASIVSVMLNNGKEIKGVVLLYPNYVVAIEGESELSFIPSNVVNIYQTENDLSKGSASNWLFFYNPEEFNSIE